MTSARTRSPDDNVKLTWRVRTVRFSQPIRFPRHLPGFAIHLYGAKPVALQQPELLGRPLSVQIKTLESDFSGDGRTP